MINVAYKPSFIRQFSKLPPEFQDEVLARIDLLKDTANFKALKVHKLHGALSGKWSFSVDYKNRIVFKYISKQEIVLLAIGDHAVYD
jgi:mRNA-degrading endonuclease YafQ of YafQ-DinJ toxin-antitoxin module